MYASASIVSAEPRTAYRGPPDPLRGDAPYRLVREEAHVPFPSSWTRVLTRQMVINNLFTADSTRDDGPTGMGSSNGGNTSDPSMESPVKKPMQGMANPNIVPEKSSSLTCCISLGLLLTSPT